MPRGKAASPARAEGAFRQRAEVFARALRDAFERGLFPERALWVVNAGLWHIVCNHPGADDQCYDPSHAERVGELLEALQKAQGEVLWRPTTAVHRDQ